MSKIEIVTRDGGQDVLVVTCDQQLCQAVLVVIWANPEHWKSVCSKNRWNAVGDKLYRVHREIDG